jgi:hypothetical protein
MVPGVTVLKRKNIFKLQVQITLEREHIFFEPFVSSLFLQEPEGHFIDGTERVYFIAYALAPVNAPEAGKKLLFDIARSGIVAETPEKNVQVIEEFAFPQLLTLSP